MPYYHDDFYNEPTEFDGKVEELKESLAGAVKKEFLEEMERLKKENQKLQGIKAHFEQVKRDYENKKLECERVMRNAEQNALRMRAYAVMDKFKLFEYTPQTVRLYRKKCEKCDSSRQIMVELPSGKKVYDECECGRESVWVEVPRCLIRYEITSRDCSPYVVAFYKAFGIEENGRYYDLDYAASVYSEGEDIDALEFSALEKRDKNRILFRSEERCREYCEYLNRKNNVPADMIYELKGNVYECTKGLY